MPVELQVLRHGTQRMVPNNRLNRPVGPQEKQPGWLPSFGMLSSSWQTMIRVRVTRGPIGYQCHEHDQVDADQALGTPHDLVIGLFINRYEFALSL